LVLSEGLPGAACTLAREYDVAQPRFDLVKLGGRNHIFLLGRQDARDFFLGIGDAFGRRRMRGKIFGIVPGWRFSSVWMRSKNVT